MSVDDEQAIADILATTRVLLLDFDGPICDVFAGYRAADVAEHLRGILTAEHGQQLPTDVVDTTDPLHVIRRVADLAPQLSHEIDTVLRSAEVEATKTSRPTPGSAELLAACREAGRPVAVVSNNSSEAVRAYLDRHGLGIFVQHVQGRDPDDPHRMKPNPYSVSQALAALGVPASDALLIGDSVTDIDAARAAGVRIIAYANKPGKAERLAPADALTSDVQSVARAAAQLPETLARSEDEQTQPASAE